MNISTLSGILSLLIGLIYTILALLLPDASIGRAAEPKFFPLSLGILMMLLSAALLYDEMNKKKKEDKAKNVSFTLDSNLKKIGLTCLFSILYAILFDKLGYVISTILFLEGELFLFNGFKEWKINTMVVFIFSLFIYILFSKLLGVYLPMTPGIWI